MEHLHLEIDFPRTIYVMEKLCVLPGIQIFQREAFGQEKQVSEDSSGSQLAMILTSQNTFVNASRHLWLS